MDIKKRNNGFSFVEILIVIIIISSLAAMVSLKLKTKRKESLISAVKADIVTNIITALKFYELDNGRFPTTEEGLDVLLEKPRSAVNWKGPYLKKKPYDVWGRKYEYKYPGKKGGSYDLYSLGYDEEDSEDDIISW